jgi:hypothetical protein
LLKLLFSPQLDIINNFWRGFCLCADKRFFMKKSKLILALFAFAASVTVFTACSNDDKKTTEPTKTSKELILGKWLANIEGKDENNNKVWDENEKNYQPEDFVSLEFKADGALVITEDSNEPITNGTYTLNSVGDSLTFKVDGDVSIGKINSISETKMFLEFYEEGTNTSEYYELRR